MFNQYLGFIRAVAVHRIGLAGVILTTTSFVSFFLLELLRLLGMLTNAYIGLITYLAFPAMFIVGLVLIPIGWQRRRRQTGKTARQLIDERFGQRDTQKGFFGSRVFLTIAAFTLANVIIISAASSRMLGFMDQAEFCGTACHSVMNPEWVTYQQSPHARVDCVECHVGEGVEALIDSKLNGTWQMISVTFDLYERPIPTPVHQLRPARETCEKCHWPEKFYGQRLKTVARFAKDSLSSRRYTTLSLKIDHGQGRHDGGIHWHVDSANEVRYVSVDDKREEMIWVDVRQSDGTFKRFTNQRLVDRAVEVGDEPRVMDCVDCHNRATHIYEQPDDALDSRLELGVLPRELPYLKRVAVAAIMSNYADSLAAMKGIGEEVRGFYRRELPELAREERSLIDSAVAVLKAVYQRNIHHGMNIGWGAYPSHIGHRGRSGCFRCHSADMKADDGSMIADDCTLCHSILAMGSEDAFEYLKPVDTTDVDYPMHKYLQEEFLKASK